jgi:hypothetical protein
MRRGDTVDGGAVSNALGLLLPASRPAKDFSYAVSGKNE